MSVYGLEHGKVALIVIDVQKEYFDPDGPAFVEAAASILPRVNALIAAFRRHDKPVIFIKHVNRADGSDVGRMVDFLPPDTPDSFVEGTPRIELQDGLDAGSSPIVVNKTRYSCFLGTDLEAILRTAGVRSLVITGLMTSFCCETTARDAHGRDYEVLFVSDANEGPDLVAPDGGEVPHTEVLRSTLTALSAGFAEIVSTDEVIERLSSTG